MSPLGEAFRTRLRMFPSIVNCCTIDWFMEWPDEVCKHAKVAGLVVKRLFRGETDVCSDEFLACVTRLNRPWLSQHGVQ